MTLEGNQAPAFTAPLVTDEISPASLHDQLANGPVILAFFPGAFTGVCTHEMTALEDRIEEIESHGAGLFGISVDLPFALQAFRDELELSFGLFSDSTHEIIDAYGVTTAFEDVGVQQLAKRAVFVVDTDGTVQYKWVSDDPGVEPEYSEILAAVRDLKE